jgi:hypothetical protein
MKLDGQHDVNIVYVIAAPRRSSRARRVTAIYGAQRHAAGPCAAVAGGNHACKVAIESHFNLILMPQCASRSRATRVRASLSELHARPLVQATEPAINIFYRSNWSTVKLHGSLAGGPWQDFPLQPVSALADWCELRWC